MSNIIQDHPFATSAAVLAGGGAIAAGSFAIVKNDGFPALHNEIFNGIPSDLEASEKAWVAIGITLLAIAAIVGAIGVAVYIRDKRNEYEIIDLNHGQSKSRNKDKLQISDTTGNLKHTVSVTPTKFKIKNLQNNQEVEFEANEFEKQFPVLLQQKKGQKFEVTHSEFRVVGPAGFDEVVQAEHLETSMRRATGNNMSFAPYDPSSTKHEEEKDHLIPKEAPKKKKTKKKDDTLIVSDPIEYKASIVPSKFRVKNYGAKGKPEKEYTAEEFKDNIFLMEKNSLHEIEVLEYTVLAPNPGMGKTRIKLENVAPENLKGAITHVIEQSKTENQKENNEEADIDQMLKHTPKKWFISYSDSKNDSIFKFYEDSIPAAPTMTLQSQAGCMHFLKEYGYPPHTLGNKIAVSSPRNFQPKWHVSMHEDETAGPKFNFHDQKTGDVKSKIPFTQAMDHFQQGFGMQPPSQKVNSPDLNKKHEEKKKSVDLDSQ